MLYLLDANILIRAHADYYAIDRVPQFWEWLLHNGHTGVVKVPEEIYEEMEGGGRPRPDDLLLPFLRRADVKRALILRESVDAALLQLTLAQGYGCPTPNDQEIVEMGQDPFLIAYALSEPQNRCVVTEEKTKRTQRGARSKVPDVCQDVGVRAIGPFAFFRELDFSVDWPTRLGTA